MLIDYAYIEHFYNINRKTILKLVVESDFPKPIIRGAKMLKLFQLEAVNNWIKAKEEIRVNGKGIAPYCVRKK